MDFDLGKMGSKIKDSIKDLSDAGIEGLKNLGSAGVEKITSQINDINETLKEVENVGYKVKGIEIEVGIIPSFIVKFDTGKKLTDEEVEQLKEKHKDKKFFSTIISSIAMTSKMNEKIKLGSLSYSEVIIKLSIPPTVTMGFTKGS